MKKLLLVIDYQKDFVDGTLGNSHAAAVEEKILEKIKAYRKSDDTVAFTYDTHQGNYLNTLEGKNLPVPHCIKGTPGWMLYGKIAGLKQENDPVFEKECFGSAGLFNWLKKQPFESIELVGVVTNICVISNAVLAKAAAPETPVIVDAAACASNDPALHEKALDVMESLQIQVTGR